LYSKLYPDKVLEVLGDSRSAGSRLALGTCRGSDNQKFVIEPTGVIHVVSSGLVLDCAKSQLIQNARTVNATQWEIIGNQLKLKSSGLVLEASSHGGSETIEVCLAKNHAGKNQQWNFVTIEQPENPSSALFPSHSLQPQQQHNSLFPSYQQNSHNSLFPSYQSEPEPVLAPIPPPTPAPPPVEYKMSADEESSSDEERDKAFRSGHWHGYYIQRGTQGIMDFKLKFKGGFVSGEGTDPIGTYTWSGTYDARQQTIAMRKQYLGRHCVDYIGKKCGKKEFEGTWSIPGMKKSGKFHLQKGKRLS